MHGRRKQRCGKRRTREPKTTNRFSWSTSGDASQRQEFYPRKHSRRSWHFHVWGIWTFTRMTYRVRVLFQVRLGWLLSLLILCHHGLYSVYRVVCHNRSSFMVITVELFIHKSCQTEYSCNIFVLWVTMQCQLCICFARLVDEKLDSNYHGDWACFGFEKLPRRLNFSLNSTCFCFFYRSHSLFLCLYHLFQCLNAPGLYEISRERKTVGGRGRSEKFS